MKIVPDHTPEGEGERLRDAALARLRRFRPALVRRLQRTFVRHLLAHGPSTIDPLRAAVPIPPDFDPRIVGATVKALADDRIITSVGRSRTRRAVGHARNVELWAVADRSTATLWMLTHPELADTAEGAEGGAA